MFNGVSSEPVIPSSPRCKVQHIHSWSRSELRIKGICRTRRLANRPLASHSPQRLRVTIACYICINSHVNALLSEDLSRQSPDACSELKYRGSHLTPSELHCPSLPMPSASQPQPDATATASVIPFAILQKACTKDRTWVVVDEKVRPENHLFVLSC